MTIKTSVLTFIFFYSISLFSQKNVENKEITKTEIQKIYLDSIKKTFIKDEIASCVDSLWMKELGSLDIFDAISTDITTFNTDSNVDFELPTELLKQRLAALDEKSPFNIEYNPGLENIIKSFLKNRKKAFERLMAVSEYYFPLFEESLDRKNVPLEIKYLAVVESALNPKAVSRMGATGLWQFMYQTGKQYNLKIDSYVDERSDPIKSSEAAAQYMTNMYKIFGDWDLVLASYNSGPGNVTKAIRRSGGQQNFWNIRKHLPKETQGYLPAFLATMYIYEYHKEHGIVPNRAVMKQFATDTLAVKKQLSFQQISDLVDIPVSQLQVLNPSYKMNVVPFYSNNPHYLRLPKDKAAIFASNEDKIYAYVQHEVELREKPFQPIKAIVATDSLGVQPQIKFSKTKYYTTKRGDTLEEIATKYGVDVADLKSWNNIKSSAVKRGRTLKIKIENPDLQKDSVVVAQKISKIKVENAKKVVPKDTLAVATTQYYTVQKGDNLSNIAKKNKVSVADLKQWNDISGMAIKLGQSLKIIAIESSSNTLITETKKTEDVEYVVKKGDNLGSIAKKFNSTIADLKSWNGIDTNNIALGQRLVVAKNEVLQTKTANSNALRKNTQDYFVQKGDSLYSISKKFPGVSVSDIKKWNNIASEELKPGMKLKING